MPVWVVELDSAELLLCCSEVSTVMVLAAAVVMVTAAVQHGVVKAIGKEELAYQEGLSQ
jgi:hypothetical protein